MTDALTQRIEAFARFVKLIELNGEADGFHGIDREEGWDELVAAGNAELKAAGLEGDMFTGYPGSSSSYQTFYENGWQVGMDKRIAKVKAELIAQGWPDDQNTNDMAWYTAMPTSDVEVMQEYEKTKTPAEPVPDRPSRYRLLEE